MNPPETREQRLEAKRTKMPLALADLHWHLEDELTWMHVTWKEYLELFAANDRRIDLINATAPNFFVHYEDMVWRDTMLNLCRVTDPPSSVGKSNLTIRRLAAAVDHAGLKTKVCTEVEAAVKATEFARDWRNRRIAHRSLDLVLNPQLKPLANASRRQVEDAFTAIEIPMNSIGTHYEGVHHDFAGVITAFSGSKALVYFLSSGLEADQVRKGAGTSWSPPHW
jgi:hypothetical protein